MSGGAWEYVIGYNTSSNTVVAASGITALYSNFFTSSTWNKYYDKYSANSTNAYASYPKRILADATGELGPFQSTVVPQGSTIYMSSWYSDDGLFLTTISPWFLRGGQFLDGNGSGVFSFATADGVASLAYSFLH